MEFDHVKDSGERREFGTGSVRDVRTGKGRYDLLSPIAIKRLAQHTENGAVKYGDRNWELGQPVSGYLDSGIRHLFNYMGGMRDEDHLAAAMWNVMAAIHTEHEALAGRLPAVLDDVPARFERCAECMGNCLRCPFEKDCGPEPYRENDAAAKGLAGVTTPRVCACGHPGTCDTPQLCDAAINGGAL